jgi:hypothetical protein
LDTQQPFIIPDCHMVVISFRGSEKIKKKSMGPGSIDRHCAYGFWVCTLAQIPGFHSFACIFIDGVSPVDALVDLQEKFQTVNRVACC